MALIIHPSIKGSQPTPAQAATIPPSFSPNVVTTEVEAKVLIGKSGKRRLVFRSTMVLSEARGL